MSVYRCVECGHGGQLYAWAEGVIQGPLAADGALLRYDDVEDTSVCEDSIACHEHGDTVVIEKRVDGEWCRVWVCPDCDHGQAGVGYYKRTCFTCHGRYWRWRPVADKSGAEPKVERNKERNPA